MNKIPLFFSFARPFPGYNYLQSFRRKFKYLSQTEDIIERRIF